MITLNRQAKATGVGQTLTLDFSFPGIGFACPSTGKATLFGESQTGLPDDNSEWEPPEPMPNSEVKPLSADGSVGSPHVRVGHRQALKYKTPPSRQCRGCFVFRI